MIRRTKVMMMYENLIKRLRTMCPEDYDNPMDFMYGAEQVMSEAADAVEKLVEVIQNHDFLESLVKPDWVSVTEALPKSVDDDVLVTDGEGYAVGYWRPDAQAWDSTDFGWLENRSEPPCGIHTVTHWMSLPPLPKKE